MKNLVLLLALLSANAIAAPAFYGKMNFEMRYVDQDAEGRRSEVIGAATKNLPPRLGMVGFFKSPDLDTTIMYFGEMGYHTWGNDNDFGAGEMKLRLAGVSFENKLGKAIIGRHYPATDLVGTEIDPLVDTGLSSQGMDQYYDIAAAKTFNGLGYYSRYFQDGFTYKTPILKGYQLSLSVDNNSRQNTGKTTIAGQTEYSATYYSALATNDIAIGRLKNKFYLGVIKGNGLNFNAAHLVVTASELRSLLAIKSTFENFMFGLHFSHTKYEKYQSEDQHTTTNMMVSGSCAYDRNDIGLTYSRGVFKAPTDTSVQSQLALGYKRHLAKTVALTVNAARMDIVHDVVTASDNVAYTASVGTALNF